MIGTGNLQFPIREASRIMLDEVVSFCDNNPHSSVKDVRFVIFDQDQNLITAFQQEMSSLQLRRGSVAKSGNTVRMRTHECANLLAGHVEWRYVLHGETRRFSSTKNAKIEEAYIKKSPNVTVELCGDQFQLHFRDNTGKGRLSGEKIKISRKVVGTSEGKGWSISSADDLFCKYLNCLYADEKNR